MKNIFRRLLTVILFLVAGVQIALAQYSETREFRRAFKVNPQMKVEIINKYGKIDIKTWAKDSVAVEVSMTVEENRESKIEKSFDNIDFNFSNTPNYLMIETITDKNRSVLGSELLNFKETLLQSSSSIEINYVVWMPSTYNLKVENKFGDISLDDYEGIAEIDLSNGKLKAQNLTKKTTLTLDFAGATINSLPDGIINSNYSDVLIKTSGQLDISTKSSEIEINENNRLTINSRRDKFIVRQTENIEADASFSDFRISSLTNMASLRLNYGDLEIEKVEAGFNDLLLTSSSTDININFSPESTFNFELTESKTDVDMEEAFVVTERDEIDSSEQTNNIQGHYGDVTDGKEKLQINSTSGSISLRAY